MTAPAPTTQRQRRERVPAVLVLEDGRTFRGQAYGATGEAFGEAVFNTG
ncbi:carbamoyl-phosphate synthase domain-containing protein, partial [Kitasatospora sp. NPDC057500]